MKRRPESKKAALSDGFSYYKENQNAGLMPALRFYLIYLLKIWNIPMRGKGGRPYRQ
jgi:hypothetical protein